jgi:hypothetical protein
MYNRTLRRNSERSTKLQQYSSFSFCFCFCSCCSLVVFSDKQDWTSQYVANVITQMVPPRPLYPLRSIPNLGIIAVHTRVARAYKCKNSKHEGRKRLSVGVKCRIYRRTTEEESSYQEPCLAGAVECVRAGRQRRSGLASTGARARRTSGAHSKMGTTLQNYSVHAFSTNHSLERGC